MNKPLATLTTLALGAALTAAVAPAQAAPAGVPRPGPGISAAADPVPLSTAGLRSNLAAYAGYVGPAGTGVAATVTTVDAAGAEAPAPALAFSGDRSVVVEGTTVHQGDVGYTAGSPAGEAVAENVRAWLLPGFAGVARPAPGAGPALVEAAHPTRFYERLLAEVNADPDVRGTFDVLSLGPGTERNVFVVTDVDTVGGQQVSTVTEVHFTLTGTDSGSSATTRGTLDRVVAGDTVPVGQPAARRAYAYTYGPNGVTAVDPAAYLAGETYDQVVATTTANAGFPQAVKKLRKQVAKKARKAGPKKARKVLAKKARRWARTDDPADLRSAKVRKGRATLRVANPFTETRRTVTIKLKGRKVTASKVRTRKR